MAATVIQAALHARMASVMIIYIEEGPIILDWVSAAEHMGGDMACLNSAIHSGIRDSMSQIMWLHS